MNSSQLQVSQVKIWGSPGLAEEETVKFPCRCKTRSRQKGIELAKISAAYVGMAKKSHLRSIYSSLNTYEILRSYASQVMAWLQGNRGISLLLWVGCLTPPKGYPTALNCHPFPLHLQNLERGTVGVTGLTQEYIHAQHRAHYSTSIMHSLITCHEISVNDCHVTTGW